MVQVTDENRGILLSGWLVSKRRFQPGPPKYEVQTVTNWLRGTSLETVMHKAISSVVTIFTVLRRHALFDVTCFHLCILSLLKSRNNYWDLVSLRRCLV
jgi:hypothetical protein